MQNEKDLWKKCVEFHGHECGGLLIGFKASLFAQELIGVDYSHDEDVVCIAENDACGVDAIQVLLGCSVGKGNLLFKLRGKQAFSFYHRKTGKAVRLLLKEINGLEKQAKFAYMQKSDPEELFGVMEAKDQLSVKARIFKSIKCDQCGEMTAESMIRLQDGDKLCLDCYLGYSRFL